MDFKHADYTTLTVVPFVDKKTLMSSYYNGIGKITSAVTKHHPDFFGLILFEFNIIFKELVKLKKSSRPQKINPSLY